MSGNDPLVILVPDMSSLATLGRRFGYHEHVVVVGEIAGSLSGQSVLNKSP